MGTFFDLDPSNFNQDSQFFFNVVVYEIGLALEDWFDLFGESEIENISGIKFTQFLTSARPRLYFFYPLDEKEAQELDSDCYITYYDHQVVMMNSNDIAWTEMIDFETQGLWGFE